MTKRIYVILIFFGIAFKVFPQQANNRGILILDYARNHTSMDLFLPCDIDETKSLKDNIALITTDTAKLVSLNVKNYNEIIAKSTIIENEGFEHMADNFKYKRIIPVEIEIDRRFDPNQQHRYFDFGELQMKFFGHVVSPGYDARRVLYLSQAKIIKLR